MSVSGDKIREAVKLLQKLEHDGRRIGRHALAESAGLKDAEARMILMAWNNKEQLIRLLKTPKISSEIESDINTRIATVKAENELIRTLPDLFRVSELNPADWIVKKCVVNKWANQYQIKAFLDKKHPDEQRIPVIQPLSLPKIKQIKCRDKKVNLKKTFFWSDLHVGFDRDYNTGKLTPYHDERCVKIAMSIVKREQPDEIILGGDMLDIAEAGKYAKKPEFFYTLQPAINYLGTVLAQLRQIAPKADIVYIPGNHEERLPRHLAENMIFAFNLKGFNSKHELFSLQNLLDLDAIDIKTVDNYPKGEYFICKRLRAIHGEFIKQSTELNNSDISTIHGHSHSNEEQYKTRRTRDSRKPVVIHSVGCSCHIDGRVPAAKSHMNWQQSFSWIESIDDYFNIQRINVWEGSAIFKGIKYN